MYMEKGKIRLTINKTEVDLDESDFTFLGNHFTCKLTLRWSLEVTIIVSKLSGGCHGGSKILSIVHKSLRMLFNAPQ